MSWFEDLKSELGEETVKWNKVVKIVKPIGHDEEIGVALAMIAMRPPDSKASHKMIHDTIKCKYPDRVKKKDLCSLEPGPVWDDPPDESIRISSCWPEVEGSNVVWVAYWMPPGGGCGIYRC